MSSEHAYPIEPVAHIRTPFAEKFGIPRQSGLVDDVKGTVVFEPEYRDLDALRGIEAFSHLWLVWGFSEVEPGAFAPVVRPPRLGGNEKRGVFASRSPFRPNRLGLSVVRLDGIEATESEGTVLRVSGVDLLDGTPIYDVKPYLPYADSIPDAVGGFAQDPDEGVLDVTCPPELEELLGDDLVAVRGVLARDPRPAYHHDEGREYGMSYGRWSVRFKVDGDALSITSVNEI